MPELPEVETIARDLKSKISNLKIKKVEVFDERILRNISAAKFIQSLKDKTISSVYRRGKGLIFTLDGLYLISQVKMTGYFVYGKHLREEQSLKETKAVFHLSNGKYLNYNDHRLFGKFQVTNDLKEIQYLQTIGPEPLNGEFNPNWLIDNLKKRKTPIKPLLMNQEFVAGIGNIYASEILFDAQISPLRKSNRIKKEESQKLYQSTVRILKEAIDCRGSSMRNYRDSDGKKGEFFNRIKVYGKEDEACPSCKNLIQKIVQGQRSTFYCRNCQK